MEGTDQYLGMDAFSTHRPIIFPLIIINDYYKH